MDNRYNELTAKKEKLESEATSIRNRINTSKNLNSSKMRKARTRRLIQKGALLEKYFHLENTSVENTEKILAYFSDYVQKYTPERFK